MTADERIEKLLNHFGQTISDLPKPDNTAYAYKFNDIDKAYDTAFKWRNERVMHGVQLHSGDYICHLADVIDRMEAALETAILAMDCQNCEMLNEDCQLDCESNAKIADWQLHMPYNPFFTREVQDDSGRTD